MKRRKEKSLFIPPRRKHHFFIWFFSVLLLVLGLVIGLNTLANLYPKVIHQKVTILDLDKQLEGLKILHLSDLHATLLGPGQENLKQMLKTENFDLVCMTGDMVGQSGNLAPFNELLKFLPEKTPIFLVEGDEDQQGLDKGDGKRRIAFDRLLEKHHLVKLDAPYKLSLHGQTLWLCPQWIFEVDLPSMRKAYEARRDELQGKTDEASQKSLQIALNKLSALDSTDAAFKEIEARDLLISLSHLPPISESISPTKLQNQDANAAARPKLYLCGHLMNGQIRLPGLGYLYLPPTNEKKGGWFQADIPLSGIEIIKGTPVYTSPGLGASRLYPLPLRLFNPPCATLLTLTRKLSN